MNTMAFIVLGSIFGNLRCANTFNTRKQIKQGFQVHRDQNNRQMKSYSIKTMPNLINIDRDSIINKIKFRTDNRELKFTDFILEAAIILKTYEDSVLKDVFAILDDELGNNVYNGCKSDELVKLKRHLGDHLGALKDTPTEKLRDHLDNMIKILRREEYGDLTETVKLVNSLYVGENDKFIKVLLALMFKKLSPSVDLDDIVRRSLRHLFIDHYCTLSDEVRHDLILTIEHYWKQFVNIRYNTNKMAFVTPFDGDLVRKSLRKKRFKTVNERRPVITNKNAKSDSYEHTTKHNKKLDLPEEAQDYLDKIERKPKTHEFRSLTTRSESQYPIITDMTRDKNIEGAYYSFDYDENMNNDKSQTTSGSANEAKHEAARSSVNNPKQTDLDKLKNIKLLAEELIKDMARQSTTPEVKSTSRRVLRRTGKVTDEPDESKTVTSLPSIRLSLRQDKNIVVEKNYDINSSTKKIESQGEDATNLKSLWQLPLQFVKGDISIISQYSKTKDDNEKDVAVEIKTIDKRNSETIK